MVTNNNNSRYFASPYVIDMPNKFQGKVFKSDLIESKQEMFKGSELQFDNNKARNISSLIPCQPKK